MKVLRIPQAQMKKSILIKKTGVNALPHTLLRNDWAHSDTREDSQIDFFTDNGFWAFLGEGVLEWPL